MTEKNNNELLNQSQILSEESIDVINTLFDIAEDVNFLALNTLNESRKGNKKKQLAVTLNDGYWRVVTKSNAAIEKTKSLFDQELKAHRLMSGRFFKNNSL